MNLVFFDIECACVYKYTAKICAFGYVVCDEKFNILQKEDILINPNGKFHLTDRKGNKGIVLPYEYTDFKKYPDFPKIYPKIKSLLENKNNYIFGHAAKNDVNYLNLETKRYNLSPLNFRYGDTQLLYMTHKSDYSHQLGLGFIAEALGIEFTAHRAADDAYATMCVLRELCTIKGCGVRDLGKILEVRCGRTEMGKLYEPASKGQIEYLKKLDENRKLRSKKQEEFGIYFSRKKRGQGKLKGKVFTFSRSIEEDLPLSENLVDRIYQNGGTYSRHVSKSDFYIASEDDTSNRTKLALQLDGVKVTSPQGLEELING